jgi:peptidoglycan/LPS O-acetylase OafA/YrhL
MARRRYSSDYDSSSSRASGRRRRERRMEERRTETVTFVLIMLLFVFYIAFPGRISTAWISVIGGVILTGSAIYQNQRRWRVNPMTWVGGAIMLLAGIFALNGGGAIPGGIFLPIGIFAAVIILSFMTGEL